MKKLLFLLLCLVGVFFYNWRLFISSSVDLVGGKFSVVQGDNLSSVEAALLKGNEAFYPKIMYRVYRNVYPITLKPGTRQFEGGATFVDVYHALEKDVGPVRVRLPEGERLETYADILARAGIGSEKDILECFRACSLARGGEYRDMKTGFEGFLFPDTYLFDVGMSTELLVSTMINNFSRRTEPLIQKYSTFVKQEGLRKVIIMASLLEREARTLEDKRMVAGILYRRLDIGMRLDVDATVLYVVGDWKAPLTAAELAMDSPYNTRRFAGLPPGPIANPSLESIEAAMSPIASTYLYYLNGSNGATHYATTLEGHVQNKWKYL